MHFHDMNLHVNGHTLAQEPLPRGHEILNFDRLFPSHHYYILSLSDICMGVEKKIFKEIIDLVITTIHT